ncbi:BON domain-containing protein [Ramlibacter sp.]|uniref:BON domain-containing protein n=1 Tax=Ramlibacter sp. TaxID=1917967 RepID=UPI002D498E31|nr:BON domain-containing protein [Ramlibacter sp.]HYD75895.1 BON domain-containing protein [Ramlibacter sp.]
MNKALAAATAALALLVLAGCKPAPDPRSESDRADSSPRSSTTAAAQDRSATRQAGDDPDPRTASMGAAPARALPPGVPGALPPPAGGREPDPEITAGVKARLAADAELREVRIDVDTRDGVVTLSGSVPTAAVRARAGELAHAVKGVRRVNDQLTLASG